MTSLHYRLTVFDDSELFTFNNDLLPDNITDYFLQDPEVHYLIAAGYSYSINRLKIPSMTSMTYEIVFDVIDPDRMWIELLQITDQPRILTRTEQGYNDVQWIHSEIGTVQ